jgi:hypothetical protein
MAILTLLVIAAYLVVIVLAKLAITPFSLLLLVAALVIVRFLKGERL